ncbi:MAG: glycosyltransferase family 2 protein [bacterium]|nr:glycosyltransferase family 2 protein [bacterium]
MNGGVSEPVFARMAAVVVNWNGGEANLACIDSLVAGGLPVERIVFVDNASRDGSFAAVQARYPMLPVIANDANLGFGEGANQGARRALEGGASAVLFANNDVTFPRETNERLAAALDADPGLGIVAPRFLYPGDPPRVWCAGGRLTWRQNVSTLLGQGELDGTRWRANRPVDYVAGAAMLVRAEVFDRIGFLDATYFAYMEDVDYCLRARNAGFGVLSLGEVHCEHAASSATGGGYSARRKYMTGVNSVHFLRRWGGASEWVRFVGFDVLPLPLLWLAGLFRGRGRAVLAKGIGILHGLRGRRVTAEQLEDGASWLW